MRAKKACSSCSKRKIKCDNLVPCSGCVQREILCTYGGLNSKQRHQKSQAIYIKSLESRIKDLESKTNDIDEDAYTANHYASSEKRFGINTRNHTLLPKELAISMLQCLDKEERKSFPIPRSQYYGWNLSGGHYLKQRTLPDFKEVIDLKDPSQLLLCNWLLDFYFKKINPLFSIIHQKVFKIQFSNYLSGINTASPRSSRLFCAILYLILAISIRFAEFHPDTPPDLKARFVPYFEEELFTNSYDTVALLSFEWQSFELIQSWILITLYLRTTHRQNSSFASLGTAIRMCKGMSLNEKATLQSCKNSYEKLKVERIFWLVYTWDRLYSYQHGDQIELTGNLVTHTIPPLVVSDEDERDDWLEAPALVLIHLANHAGDILTSTLNKAKWDVDSIEDIRENLYTVKQWININLKSSEFDSVMIDQVHLVYHDILLSLYSRTMFGLIDTETHSIFPNNIKSSTLLLESSSDVLQIFERIDLAGCLLVPWFLSLSIIFNIAMVSVGFINGGLYLERSTKYLQKCVKLITKLEKSSKMALECNWIIKLLNHICARKSIKTSQLLTDIGTDRGPENVNESTFYQFSTKDEIQPGSEMSDQFQYDDLMQGNLEWFDQWFDNMEIFPDIRDEYLPV